MKSFLTKKYTLHVLIWILLSVFFFSSRLYNLTSLPMFNDEAIYIHWAQVAKADPSARFISLGDGKQPSFIWAVMLTMYVIKDPLLAGRIISVFAGFATMIGLYFLGKELFASKRIGFFSAFLYIVYPFALVFDRMALYDSLVGTFAVWNIYLAILLVKKIRLDVAFILALTMGGGVLTKTSGFLSMYLLPVTLVLFDWKQRKKWIVFCKWMGCVLLAVILANGYYLVLYLSKDFSVINEKNALFVYHLRELVPYNAFDSWGKNILLLLEWIKDFATYPVIFLVLFSFFVYKKFFKEKILLWIWFAIPLVGLALFGRILYIRYIFFMTLFLLPLAAVSLEKIHLLVKQKILFVLSVFIFLFLMIRADYFILTDFARAPIPVVVLEEFSNSWSAGGGIKEIIAFLDKESKKQKISIVAEGIYGSLPKTAVEIYLKNNSHVEYEGMEIENKLPSHIIKKAKKMPVYIILNQTQQPPPKWQVKRIAKYRKGIGNTYMSLYQVVVWDLL